MGRSHYYDKAIISIEKKNYVRIHFELKFLIKRSKERNHNVLRWRVSAVARQRNSAHTQNLG